MHQLKYNVYYPIFGDTATNFRRWNYCFAGIAFLLLLFWFILSFAPEPQSGSRGWGPALGYMILTAVALLIYWALLLAQLCSSLKLNTALWLVASLLAAPLSIALVHFLIFFKVKAHLEFGEA